MGLNIKNEHVHRLIRELAARTGTSMTASIETAVREKLARLDQEEDGEAMVARARRIVRESGPTAADVSSDHSDLYDDAGLPA
jgi:antitoxin VapB